MTETIAWIPTSQELPDADEAVLICTTDGVAGEASYQEGEIWFLAQTFDAFPGTVTHWARMPEGPRNPGRRS